MFRHPGRWRSPTSRRLVAAATCVAVLALLVAVLESGGDAAPGVRVTRSDSFTTTPTGGTAKTMTKTVKLVRKKTGK